KKKIIDLPDGGRHFTRTITFMPLPSQISSEEIWEGEPDHEKLLISVGSSCDVCDETDWRRAKILIANADGSDLKEFAKGLRNSVFMATHPVMGKIWATEMGRDLLGDNLPPDEVNIVEEGKNFGWPICFGKNIHDAKFDPAPEQARYGAGKNVCDVFAPSYIDIQAHSAPLGLAFFPEDPPSREATDGQVGWPQEYWYNLLVAYHGSWNRTDPTGYKVVRFKLDAQGNYLGDGSAGSPQGEDFISGWLIEPGITEGGALGRPVDLKFGPDHALYISDDKAGVVYRVTYPAVENK
ncbi:MAG: hypothetical protein G01um101466_598, partial [Parcubacteria group bacterium Gr01-1014_66]